MTHVPTLLQMAISLIARMLHGRPNHFQTAGTKDKRGVTCQQVTAWKVCPYLYCKDV